MHRAATAQGVEIVEVAMPDRVSAARAGQSALPVFRDHDKTADTELWRRCVAARFIPDLAVFFIEGTRFASAVEADHVQALGRRARGAVDRVDSIPHGRMRFLKRLELHRNIVKGKML